jgi:hypothetical protein
MLTFDLKIQTKTITRFRAECTEVGVLRNDGSPDREIGTYMWTAWRDKVCISAGQLNHYKDMGVEFLAYLVLQDFWEDQIARLIAEQKMTRHEAEQEIARGRPD